nr:MAG TPA_asm: hypothetical protein [Caudoviricetes sp.]
MRITSCVTWWRLLSRCRRIRRLLMWCLVRTLCGVLGRIWRRLLLIGWGGFILLWLVSRVISRRPRFTATLTVFRLLAVLRCRRLRLRTLTSMTVIRVAAPPVRCGLPLRLRRPWVGLKHTYF